MARRRSARRGKGPKFGKGPSRRAHVHANRAALQRWSRPSGKQPSKATAKVSASVNVDVARAVALPKRSIDMQAVNETWRGELRSALEKPSHVGSVLVGFTGRGDRSELESMVSASGAGSVNQLRGFNIVISRDDADLASWASLLNSLFAFINANNQDLRCIEVDYVAAEPLPAAYSRNAEELREMLKARVASMAAIREEGAASHK